MFRPSERPGLSERVALPLLAPRSRHQEDDADREREKYGITVIVRDNADNQGSASTTVRAHRPEEKVVDD
jgi:hypothetical protein